MKPSIERDEASPWRVVALALVIASTLMVALARFSRQDTVLIIEKESSLVVSTSGKKKNIVLFLVDDQGHNDIGAESTDLSWATPRLSQLASEGSIRLNRHYAMHLCTPARAALLTGILPIHTGMQSSMISSNTPWGLPLRYELMSDILKKDEYASHAFGKWHLGHFHEAYLPTSRGFDSFFGSYSGFQDHFTHVSEISFCEADGAGCWYDLHDGQTPVRSHQDEFAIFVLGEAATTMIQDHPKQIPFFLYFAAPTVHMPIQPPEINFTENLKAIPNSRRRAFAAETLAMDTVAGALIDSLRDHDFWENTIFVCTSDNGAQPQVVGAGSNYPLRGMKGFYFEGGVRTPAFISAPFLQLSQGLSYDGLFSIVDWLPTLLEAATHKKNFDYIDGKSHWEAFLNLAQDRDDITPNIVRDSLVLNIDEFECEQNATAPECLEGSHSYITGSVIVNSTMKLLRNVIWLPVWAVPITNDLKNTSANAEESTWADAGVQDFVFNLKDDPTESNNLVHTQPELYQALLEAFDHARQLIVPSVYCPYSDDENAAIVFNRTQYIGPWRTNSSLSNCIDPTSTIDEEVSMIRDRNEPNVVPVVEDELSLPTSTTSVQFPGLVYCRYGLLPPSSSICLALQQEALHPHLQHPSYNTASSS